MIAQVISKQPTFDIGFDSSFGLLVFFLAAVRAVGFVAGFVAGRRGVRTGGGVVESEKLITRRPLVLAARCPQSGQVARPAGMVAPHLLQKRAGEVLRRAAGTLGG